MRRLTSAVTTALLLAAPAAGVARAQQAQAPRPQTTANQAPPGAAPASAARAPRHLLRNGQDYLGYGEFERALQLFREAESRLSELTPDEQAALRKGMDQARQGMATGVRQTAMGTLGPGRRAGATGRPAGPPPGALALDESPARVSGDGVVLTAAQQRRQATAPVAPAPIEMAEPGVVTASASDPAGDPPPFPADLELPPIPDLSSASAPVEPPSTPVEVPALPTPEAPPLPAEVPALPTEVPTFPTPEVPTLPTEVPALPVQPAEAPAPLPDLPSEPAPAELPAAPVAAFGLPAEPVPVAVPELPADSPPVLPGLPPLPQEPVEAAAEPPASDIQATRYPAMAPVPAQDSPAGPQPLPPLPPPADQMIDQAPASAAAGPGPATVSDLRPSSLPDTLRREVEVVARRQVEERTRRQPEPLPSPFADNAGGGGRSDLAASSIELSRPPSPTESRPIEAIPVPEEFETMEARRFDGSRKYWAAAATCHGILYFQDPVLERYGVSSEQRMGRAGRFFSYPLDDPTQSTQRNQILQPFVSVGRFAAQIATFPYKVLVDTPGESEYDLGYYRPGDKVPTDVMYLPHSGIGPPLHGKHY